MNSTFCKIVMIDNLKMFNETLIGRYLELFSSALGRGIALLAGNALIQQYFDKKRGRANSISGSFNALGGDAILSATISLCSIQEH